MKIYPITDEHRTMIRHFADIFKPGQKKHSETELLKAASESFRPNEAKCTGCGAVGGFSYHGEYRRNLVVFDNEVNTLDLCISRHVCASCGRTHAVLPPFIVPFGSYSLFFIIKVLREYFSRRIMGLTVSDICERHLISVSTLYKWKSLFLAHKSLWLGILEDLKVSDLDFLTMHVPCPSSLKGFSGRFGFSFLQNRAEAATVSAVP